MSFLILILIYIHISCKNEWSKGKYSYRLNIVNDEIIDDNIDLFVVSQYEKKFDHTS